MHFKSPAFTTFLFCSESTADKTGEEEDDKDDNGGDENKSSSPSKSPRSGATTGRSFTSRSAAGKSADVDPTAKMIVSEFVPVLASCHSDGFIRFWDLKVSFIVIGYSANFSMYQ